MRESLKGIFIFIVSCIILSGCKLTGDTLIRYDVFPNIEDWDLPDTATVNTPFDIYLVSTIDNSCTGNLKFYVEKNLDFQYFVWAESKFENHGEYCTTTETTVDTTISRTLNTVGKYYFYFKYNNTPKVDSIVIEP